MSKFNFDTVIAVLIEEFKRDGHEVVEQEGVHYARIVLGDTEDAITEQNLTRIADAIVRRAA